MKLRAVDGLAIEAERLVLHQLAGREQGRPGRELDDQVLVSDLRLESLAEGTEHRVALSFLRELQPGATHLGSAAVRHDDASQRPSHGLKAPT